MKKLSKVILQAGTAADVVMTEGQAEAIATAIKECQEQTLNFNPWVPPFQHIHGFITDSRGNTICQMRGWGYLTGQGALGMSGDKAAVIQDNMGDKIAKILNGDYGDYDD